MVPPRLGVVAVRVSAQGMVEPLNRPRLPPRFLTTWVMTMCGQAKARGKPSDRRGEKTLDAFNGVISRAIELTPQTNRSR